MDLDAEDAVGDIAAIGGNVAKVGSVFQQCHVCAGGAEGGHKVVGGQGANVVESEVQADGFPRFSDAVGVGIDHSERADSYVCSGVGNHLHVGDNRFAQGSCDHNLGGTGFAERSVVQGQITVGISQTNSVQHVVHR